MAKTVVKYLLFECTILIVLVIASYAWANKYKVCINMLQEEVYWSCPPDHHMRSDHHRQVQVHEYNNPILIKL